MRKFILGTEEMLRLINGDKETIEKYTKDIFKTCKNCGNLFMPLSRSDEKYCDKVIDGRSCKDIGYYNRLQNDKSLEATKQYRKAYKARNAQKQRFIKGKDSILIAEAEEKFSKWATQAKKNLKMVQAGALDLSEYVAWIEEKAVIRCTKDIQTNKRKRLNRLTMSKCQTSSCITCAKKG